MFKSLKEKRGARKLEHPLVILLLIVLATVIGVLISNGGIQVAIILVGLFPALLFLNRVFNNPPIGIYTLLIFAFTAIGLTRYIQGVPLGLSIDGFLVLTLLAFFFKFFHINYFNSEFIYTNFLMPVEETKSTLFCFWSSSYFFTFWT